MQRGRRIRVFAGLATLVLLLAACGDDSSSGAATTSGDPTTPSVTSADASDVDPDGVLRMASFLVPGAVNFDPAHALNYTLEMMHALYGNLLIDQGGTFAPGLAETVTVEDPSTLRVELREGLVFSDGTPLDAEAVKFNIERTIEVDDRTVGFRHTELETLEEIEVVDDLTALFHLSEPIAGHFMILLAGTETFIASPSAIRAGRDMSTDPVGAGPFVLESAQAERRVTMTKSGTYWAADQVQLAGIEFVHTPGVPTTQTALMSGDIDWGNVNSASAAGMRDPLEVEAIQHPAMFVMLMCKSTPPLSDVRVRKALSLATDREAIATAMYDGKVEPAWSFGPEGSPRENPALRDKEARDLPRARTLLAEAGVPDGFELEMMASPTDVVAQEVLADQWADIGVKVSIVQSSNLLQDFWIDNKTPTFPVTMIRGYLDALTVVLQPGAFSNVCGYRNPEIERVLNEGLAYEVGTDEHNQVWKDLAELVYEGLPYIPLTFHNQVVAYNTDRIGGLQYIRESRGNVIVDYHGTYIKKS